jgi:PTS system mannose-specific IID component
MTPPVPSSPAHPTGAPAIVERPVHRQRRVRTVSLLRVFWRSFFFQAATNYERMQNLGFAYCMVPALEDLYEGEALKAAMCRHLEFFNSHPYMADALLGAAVKLEEGIANGENPAARVCAFKTSMMGPMAAIGDSFFWASLKPFAAALAVAGIFSDVAWAPLVFLLLYNLFHIGMRAYGLWAGYLHGERVVEQLYRVDLVQFSDRTHYLAGLCLGVAAALLTDIAAGSDLALGQTLEPLLVAALTMIFFQFIKRPVPMLTLLYGSVALTVAVILGLNAAFPLI